MKPKNVPPRTTHTMVVEVTGATIVMVGALAAATAAAAVFVGAAGTYDAGSVSNLAVGVWDRFPGADAVWVDISMTYSGGYLEIAGDLDVCFVPPDGMVSCPLSGDVPVPRCAPSDSTQFGCWESRPAGPDLQIRYVGPVDVGFNADRGDSLGYMVAATHHSGAGTVGVR